MRSRLMGRTIVELAEGTTWPLEADHWRRRGPCDGGAIAELAHFVDTPTGDLPAAAARARVMFARRNLESVV